MDSLLPVLTLILGAGLSQWAERRRHARDRQDRRADALSSQRGEVYRTFLRSAHAAAHSIGRASEGCPMPLKDDRDHVFAAVDREVAKDLYELELVGAPEPLEAARRVRSRLYAFRQAVSEGAHYYDETYMAALGDYQGARNDFLSKARAELVEAG